MLKDTFTTIRKACSGQAAKDDVAAIICHHRIQDLSHPAQHSL